MAGTSIGAASLKVGTNNSGLQSGLDSAYDKIKGFKSKVTSTLGSMSGSMLAGGAVGAAVMGGGKIFKDALDTIKELGEEGKKAKGLGIASDQYMGLAAAAKKAGLEGETFGFTMAKSQAKVNSGSKEVEASLNKIGLSAAQMKGMSPDENFYAIAKGMESVHDQGTKAHIAVQLFGKEGFKLLPMLNEGEAGLKKFVETQKKIGTAVDQKGMDKIMEARSALPKVEQAFKGLWLRVVVAMAPMITKVAGFFTKILEFAMPVFDWLGRAAEAYYGIIGDVLGEVVSLIMEGIHAVGEWIGELTKFSGEWPSIGEVITFVLKNVGIAGAYVWDALKVGAGGLAIAVGYIIEAFGTMVSTFKESTKSILDMAGDLNEALGFDESAAKCRALMLDIDALTNRITAKSEALKNWGKGTVENFGKSAKDVENWFAKRKEKGVKDAVKNAMADQIDVAFKYQGTAALDRGTKEEYAARVRWQVGSSAAADKQLGELKKANGLNKQAVGELQKMNAKPGVAWGKI